MRIADALPLLLSFAGACVNQAPPSSSSGAPQPAANAAPPATLAPPAATITSSTTTSAVTTQAPTVATPAAPAAGGAPPGLIGNWVSNACDTRKYPRKIHFASDGKVDAVDLVAPCGPKVQCIWSGIVDRHGTYAVLAGSITMTFPPAEGLASFQFPTSLEIEKSTSAPVETTAGARCVYTKDTAKN